MIAAIMRLFGYIRCTRCHRWKPPFRSAVLGENPLWCGPCGHIVIEEGLAAELRWCEAYTKIADMMREYVDAYATAQKRRKEIKH